jgi:competence protein ComEC
MYMDTNYLLMDKSFSRQSDLVWTMVNVNSASQKGDAHVITTGNRQHILIDAGHQDTAERSLLPFLKERGIKSFDIVFISHPHQDHYGGLDVLLDSGIGIDEIYFDLPDRTTCDREIPWGCDYTDVVRVHRKLDRRGIVVGSARAGQIFQIGNGTCLEVLYAFDGATSPVAGIDINDHSLIMRLSHGKFRFLFTGDLNHKLGEYLAVTSDDIGADVLKVPHHAVENLAPNTFFEKVDPRYGLISAPEHLWASEQSDRVRNWFSDNGIPVYISGVSGNINVIIDGDQLNIRGEL